MVWNQPPPQALRFSHGRGERETRVTCDELQRTMGRVQTAGEAPLPRPLPAFLCAHIFIERETSGLKSGVKWENKKYKLERSIDLFYSFDQKQCKIIFLHEKTAQSPEDFFRTLFNKAAVSMFRIPIGHAATSYDSLQIQERLPFKKLKLVRQIRIRIQIRSTRFLRYSPFSVHQDVTDQSITCSVFKCIKQ